MNLKTRYSQLYTLAETVTNRNQVKAILAEISYLERLDKTLKSN